VIVGTAVLISVIVYVPGVIDVGTGLSFNLKEYPVLFGVVIEKDLVLA
jgi:hypothetical protein